MLKPEAIEESISGRFTLSRENPEGSLVGQPKAKDQRVVGSETIRGAVGGETHC